jgi:TetR/AcrR family transcriptional regulator
VSDSRTTLLQAAAEEFAQHGLKGARVQAIVARAGVNERMIYHHFGSKQGLYQAAVADQRAGVAELWWPALERAAGMAPYEGMREAVLGLYRVFRQRPLLLGMFVHEWLSGTQTSPFPAEEELPTQMRRLYKRGQADGTFARDVPFGIAYGVAVAALVSLTTFLPRFLDGVGDTRHPEEIDGLLVDQVLNGMTGRP